MEKTEKPKITQALLEECMKAHEELSKSGKLYSDACLPVFFTQRPNRERLLRECLNRGLSQSTILCITEQMEGKSHEEREQIAAELLLKVKAGEFDAMERTDYSPDRR